jgi:hypothetical protein
VGVEYTSRHIDTKPNIEVTLLVIHLIIEADQEVAGSGIAGCIGGKNGNTGRAC